MHDVATLFREYARLDLKRLDRGLCVRELERWSVLRERLDHEFKGAAADRRRSSKRVQTRLTCSYATRHDLGEAVITNLATGGVFIRTSRPLPVGETLVLRICLEDTGSEIEVEGVVVSNNIGPRLEPGTKGMGVRFSRVASDVLEQIGALYAQELQRDVRHTESSGRSASKPLRKSA